MAKPPIVPVSKANNRFQHLEVLKRNRAKRTSFGEVFIEGVRAINLARENGWIFKQVVFRSDKPLSNWANELIDGSGAREAVSLSPDLMDSLSDRESPSELIAVVERKSPSLSDISTTGRSLIVITDRPASPGNLGSIIRSCDAFGAKALLISGHGADPYEPRAIRSSLGTVFCMPVYEIGSNEELEDWIAAQRSTVAEFCVVGTSAKATTLISACDLTGPRVIILGNETYGMSKHLRELVDETVTIPISGSASSLNVASAATVALYERARQNTMNREDPQ